MKTEYKRILTSIIFILISGMSFGQPDVMPPPGPPVTAPGLPIDGGVLAGVLVGLFYGAKKVLKR